MDIVDFGEADLGDDIFMGYKHRVSMVFVCVEGGGVLGFIQLNSNIYFMVF